MSRPYEEEPHAEADVVRCHHCGAEPRRESRCNGPVAGEETQHSDEETEKSNANTFPQRKWAFEFVPNKRKPWGWCGGLVVVFKAMLAAERKKATETKLGEGEGGEGGVEL